MRKKILTAALALAMVATPISASTLTQQPKEVSAAESTTSSDASVKPYITTDSNNISTCEFHGTEDLNFAYYESSTGFAKGTTQYKMTHNRRCTKYNKGFVKYGGRYCIAVGSGITTELGTKLNVKLSNGKSIKCVVTDRIADTDSDSENHIFTGNGKMSPLVFIVNTKKISNAVKTTGNAMANETFCDKKGNIASIVKFTYKN